MDGRERQHLARHHDRNDTGDLVQRCTSDVETTRQFLAAQVMEIGNAAILTLTALSIAAAGFFVGLTWIVAVVMNYVKRDDVRGTWLESHFDWQIRTFWWGLLWAVVGGILTLVVVGIAVLFADAVWIIYRIVKGWLNLVENKPLPVKT